MNNSNLKNNLSSQKLRIGELPILKVASIDSLMFHEYPDNARLIKLVERFGSESILKNPPIVARMKDEARLIILDGANRTSALQKLNFKHIVVQEIDFDDDLLKLHCWHHAVERLDRSFFMIKLSQIEGIKTVEREPFVTNGDERQNLKSDDSYLCRLIFRDNSVLAIKGSTSLTQQIRQLTDITSLYLNTPNCDRVSYIDLDKLNIHYPEFQSLITFRQFSKGNIREMTKSGRRFPAGITRIFLPKRALGLNVPLDFLKSGLSLDEKQQWLDNMVIEKVRSKAIRFYQEPTFRFDE